jgi:hypothetical protein
MSKSKLLFGILVIIGGYIVATPYITIYQMKAAAERQDGEALSEFIEFPSVRQSLKDQLNTLIVKSMGQGSGIEGNPMTLLGASFAGALVEKMVDAYVTPSGISELMSGSAPTSSRGGKAVEDGGTSPFNGAKLSYESLDKFTVKLESKEDQEFKFVLRRRGIDWKITEIIIKIDK